LHLAVTSQYEDIAIDLYGLEVSDIGRLCPISINGFESCFEYNVVFIKLEMTIDKIYSKLVLDVETFKEIGQLLKMNLLYVKLVFVV